MAIYYKVVYQNRYEEYESCSVSSQSKFCLKYNIGQRVYPKVGKIFAFKSLKNAQFFQLKYRCEGVEGILKGYGKCSKWKPTRTYVEDSYNFRKFWTSKNRIKNGIMVPPGTILLDWFEPSEIIKI